MSDKLVFFSRCRPQEADPIDLVLQFRRVFIGYSAWVKNVTKVRGRLRRCIIDLNCSDEEWAAHCREFDAKNKAHYQQNRNLVCSVKPGAIALIPRPKRGLVYAGRIKTPFELLDNPPWGDKYLDLRRAQGLYVDDQFSHLGDIAQSWAVDRFIPIPFPLIPAWIRRSLFGRSTYGRISTLEELEWDPYPILERLMKKSARPALKWTTDLDKVEGRLLDGVGPNSFEHLCVHLLQLEDPKSIWMHVGGSGDGGVDGEGASRSGKVTGLLQCKWSYGGEEIELSSERSQRRMRQIVAALICQKVPPVRKDVEFWSRRDIASLVVKHHRSLPLARSLRIGKQPA
jgi:restriction endonuclease